MKLLAGLLLLVVVPLLVQEFGTLAPWLAERLLRWATRWMPPEHRERCQDDWLGELDAAPGQVTKLVFAVSILVRVPAMQRALTGRDAIWVEATRRLLAAVVTALLAVVGLVTRLAEGLPDRTRKLEGDANQIVPSITVEGQPRAEWGTMTRVLTAWGKPVTELDLPDRTANTLRRARIRSYEELAELYNTEGAAGFFRIRNFGRRDMIEVTRLLGPDPTKASWWVVENAEIGDDPSPPTGS